MARHKWEEWAGDEKKIAVLAAWARTGMTDEDIAKNIGITRSTLSEWKKKHENIRNALSTGKEIADRLVENSLFDMTQGKIVKVKKAFKLKVVEYDAKGRKTEKENIEVAEEEQYIEPDFKAIAFWLKNRMPEVWREKIDKGRESDEGNNTGMIVLTPQKTQELREEIREYGAEDE